MRSTLELSVLEGLRLYELRRGPEVLKMRAAQRRGREFLLVHRLFCSHRTGEVIKPVLVRFSFPPRWHYDILRAVDYFEAVNAPCDRRLAEAIGIVRPGRREDGCWSGQHSYKGKTYFELERLGAPSRWKHAARAAGAEVVGAWGAVKHALQGALVTGEAIAPRVSRVPRGHHSVLRPR